MEPNAALVPALQKVRSRDRIMNMAVAPCGTTSLLLNITHHHELSSVSIEHIQHFGALATIERTVEVPAIAIDELLARCFSQPLDILSIDIEGLDLAVLTDARMDSNPPLYIVIEHDKEVVRGNDLRILEVMAARDYLLLCETDVNFIFRRRS